MSDRRLEPDPQMITQAARCARINIPVTDLLKMPRGPRDRQLIYGDLIEILGTHGAHSYIRAQKDGYIGYVLSSILSDAQTPTHRVTALASHAYAAADIKSPDLMSLTFGSQVTALGETKAFIETSLGYLPRRHLSEMDTYADDPVAIARMFLGTPYLWGGNSRLGLDCSGLVQAALLACAIPCPGDSDLQQSLGRSVTDGTHQRGDLLFWPGHVAMIADEKTLIHATAHSMCTTQEPLDPAMARIAHAAGPLRAHKRL